MAVHRRALWALLAAKLVGGWGVGWDIRWHLVIGRDSFWIAPHVMTYASVVVASLISLGVLLIETWRTRHGARSPGVITVAGLSGTRGFHLTWWGMAIVILAAPIDDLWHRLFGLDVTLWSPPHLLGLLGSAVNTLGTLVIAAEVYPIGSRTRLAALLLGSALLYGGVRVVLEPAWLTAFTHGGVAFHAFAILGALALPLALIPAVRLIGRRWTPVAVVVVALGVSLLGEQIARVGFEIVKPESVIGEEIQKDPTSAIAMAAAIRAKSRGASMAQSIRYLMPILAAAVMAAANPRGRPVAACIAYGVALLVLYGWSTSHSPAFQPLIPSAAETAVAIAITCVAALIGAIAARRLADGLGAPAAEPAQAVVPESATSPAR